MNKAGVLKAALVGALVVYFGIVLFHLATQPRFQWDFKIYYSSAQALLLGQNPYDAQALARVAGQPLMPCLYPPQGLLLYLPFVFFSYAVAAKLYLLFKLIVWVLLFVLWQRYFLKKPGMAFVLFSLLAFNSAVYLDLRSGNPNAIEQAFIWAAFFFFLREKLFLFCLFVILAASLKLQPILLLFFLLFSSHPHRLRYLAGSITVFAVLNLALWVARPDLWAGFIQNAGSAAVPYTYYENGRINPSTFAVVNDLFRIFSFLGGPALPKWLPVLVYQSAASLIVLTTAYRLREARRQAIPADRRIWLYAAVMAYALALPRFKDYTYVMLLVPAFYMIEEIMEKPQAAGCLALGLLFVLPVGSMWPGSGPFVSIFWEYYPWFLAFGVWVFYMKKLAHHEELR